MVIWRKDSIQISVLILRNLVDDNADETTTVSIAVEAIIRSDKGTLLKRFITETNNLNIADGADGVLYSNKVADTSIRYMY